MNISTMITSLYKGLSKRDEVRALIPMGYVPGIPMLAVKNEYLVAIVPFLKYKITGTVDHTLVFPVKYVMEFALPESTLTAFRNLDYEEQFAKVDFNKGIGFFRHEEIKNLSKEEYQNLRKETLAQLDKLCAFLIENTPYTQQDDHELSDLLSKIVEPSLMPFYKALDNDFFNKYLK